MAIKITQPITGYQVLREEDKPVAPASIAAPAQPARSDNVIQMHERLERPDLLVGATYKIKPPVADNAMYITINDIVLNEGTEHEHRRPFEIFINSKNMEHFQWIVALTRIISAVFRKGGDITFLAEELKAVFDPRGGYWRPGGRYMPSLVAEIGDVIERHLRFIGMLPDAELDERQLKLIEEKRAQYEARTSDISTGKGAFPAGAQLCAKCHTKAVVLMDGCMTCLNCGDSKCG